MSQQAARMLHLALFALLAINGVVVLRPDVAEGLYREFVSTAKAQADGGSEKAPPQKTRNLRRVPKIVAAPYPKIATSSSGIAPSAEPANQAPSDSTFAPARNTTALSPPVRNRAAGVRGLSTNAPGQRPLTAGPGLPGGEATVSNNPSADRRVASSRTFEASIPSAESAGGDMQNKQDDLALRHHWPDAAPMDTGRIIARVGSEVILAGEVTSEIRRVEDYLKQLPSTDEAKDAERRKLMRQLLEPLIEEKLRYCAAKHEIPAANFPKVLDSVSKHFEEKQLPTMLTRMECKTRAELAEKAKAGGEDLERIKKRFVERILGDSFASQKVGDNIDIPHADLFDYYQSHLADYEFKSRVRWQAIRVHYGLRAPIADKKAAWDKLAAARNRIQPRQGSQPEPFDAVAKELSDAPNASDGGLWDWTNQGSLADKKLDAALFTMPVNLLSQIIESDDAMYLVRVLERQQGGRQTFPEVQKDIRKLLTEQSRKKKEADYLARIKEIFPITTIYDETNVERSSSPSSIARKNKPQTQR